MDRQYRYLLACGAQYISIYIIFITAQWQRSASSFQVKSADSNSDGSTKSVQMQDQLYSFELWCRGRSYPLSVGIARNDETLTGNWCFRKCLPNILDDPWGRIKYQSSKSYPSKSTKRVRSVCEQEDCGGVVNKWLKSDFPDISFVFILISIFQ